LYGCPIRRLYRLCLFQYEVLRIPFFSLLFLSFTFRLQRGSSLSPFGLPKAHTSERSIVGYTSINKSAQQK
ncbi:hypothetical protein, partial [Parabacteroides distasonis]|uniref:hypothetical protein n=1 Tax=Parabacteroides distasonis TaxID=823 RepID=UPI00321A2ECF